MQFPACYSLILWRAVILACVCVAASERKAPPVVSHVKGGQKAAPTPHPPTILSDVHERVPGSGPRPTAATATPSGQARDSNVEAPRGGRADAESHAASHACPPDKPTSVDRKTYTTVKNKFKPVRGPQPSTTDEKPSPPAREAPAEQKESSSTDVEGVTPVLFFDVAQGASENEMEGALRVTTAEALNLSAADLDAMHEQLDAAHRDSDAHQGEADAAYDSEQQEEGVEEGSGTGTGTPQQRRRPRLRKRAGAADASHPGLPTETQQELQRQAVADMFK
jgi:hypothetical protein